MLLYYITDRSQFPGDQSERRRRLLEKIAEAAKAGVDYVQLREKDLSARDLQALAREAVRVISENTRAGGNPTRLLINSRTDVALAAGADGVHLRSNDVSPSDVRKIWTQCGAGAPARGSSRRAPMIFVSCHSADEVRRAAQESADVAILAPIFEKRGSPNSVPAGLQTLRQASRHQIPVLALGGITLDNARACMEAGAAGIAAIRLFQENPIAEVVRRLRQDQ